MFGIVLLSLGLLYEWSSEKRGASIQKQLDLALEQASKNEEGIVSIESDELVVRVAVETGAIIETRLKKYPVENITGSLGFRVFGQSPDSAFNYYFKSGFTGTNPSFVVSSMGDDFVSLIDERLGIIKTISFLSSPYEISVYDRSLVGVDGKSFAGLYRTEGRSLDLKTDVLSGGMMNNSSFEGVAISTESDPYKTSRLRSIDEPIEALSRSGWIAFIQKYFFAAILGSDEYIYNYYVLPKESGLFRMGYTVESSAKSSVVFDHTHRLFVGPKIRKDLMQRAKNLELSKKYGLVLVFSTTHGFFYDL
jgi:membrane protein insertase, YidC/Oxa1 family, N-terminal domain